MKRLMTILTLVALWLALPGAADVQALTISGPTLSNDLIASHAGLSITALEDVFLTGFAFQNQGQADTINLYREDGASLTLIETYSSPINHPSYLVSGLSWAMEAGYTYRLLQEEQTNGKWIEYSFPTANSEIQVNGAWQHVYGGDYYTTSYWMNFNNITTSPVPLPASALLLGSGLLGLIGIRRFRKS